MYSILLFYFIYYVYETVCWEYILIARHRNWLVEIIFNTFQFHIFQSNRLKEKIKHDAIW